MKRVSILSFLIDRALFLFLKIYIMQCTGLFVFNYKMSFTYCLGILLIIDIWRFTFKYITGKIQIEFINGDFNGKDNNTSK